MHAVYQWQQLGQVNDKDKDRDMGIAPNALAGSPLFHRIVLVGGENVACLLGPGRHEITPVTGVEGPTCALLPVIGLSLRNHTPSHTHTPSCTHVPCYR